MTLNVWDIEKRKLKEKKTSNLIVDHFPLIFVTLLLI